MLTFHVARRDANPSDTTTTKSVEVPLSLLLVKGSTGGYLFIRPLRSASV
jgi:hypothetical protein